MPSDISRIDLACDRFEQAWKAGHRPRIEDYLAESPEPDLPGLLSELLRVEIELRREAGETIELVEYLQRLPEHADVVSSTFARLAEPSPLREDSNIRDKQFPADEDRCLCPAFGRESDDGSRHTQLGTSIPSELVAGQHPDGSRLQNPALDLTLSYVVARADGVIEPLLGPEDQARLHDIFVPGMLIHGRYALRHLLGEGGMGQVYLGLDTELERQVAIKVVSQEIHRTKGSDAEGVYRESFVKEARLGANLLHPGIATVFDFGLHQGQPFTVFEYLPGETLGELLRRRGRLSLEETRMILAPLAQGLDFAHSRHVVHRDLKPENFRATEQGQFKILDLGLATEFRRQVDWRYCGTPAYASPEQAAGRSCDGRTDQYALALIAYELLTGHRPFQSRNGQELLEMHLYDEPPPPQDKRTDLPQEVCTALMRGLEKDPARRFTSCEEFAVALGCQVLSTPSAVPEVLREADVLLRKGLRTGLTITRRMLGAHLVLGSDCLWCCHRQEVRRMPLRELKDLDRIWTGVTLRVEFASVEGTFRETYRFRSTDECREWYDQLLAMKGKQSAQTPANAPDTRARSVVLLRHRPFQRFQLVGMIEAKGKKRWELENSLMTRAAMQEADAVVEVQEERLTNFDRNTRRLSGMAIRAVDEDGLLELRSRWFSEQIATLTKSMLGLLVVSFLLLLFQGVAFTFGALVMARQDPFSSNLSAYLAFLIPLVLIHLWPLTITLLLRSLRWPQLVQPTALTYYAFGFGIVPFVLGVLAWTTMTGQWASGSGIALIFSAAFFDPSNLWLLFLGLYLAGRSWRVYTEYRELVPDKGQRNSRRILIRNLTLAGSFLFALLSTGYRGWSGYESTPVLISLLSGDAAHANLARDHLARGEIDQAIAESDEAIRRDPRLAFAYANRAAAYLTKGDFNRAIADCDEAIRLDPKLAIAYNTRAAANLNKGRIDQVIADCNEAIRLDPRLALAYANRAAAYLNKGRFDQAIADCDEAIRLDPGLALAYANRAAAYHNKGDFNRVIADCDQAIRRNPKLAIAYNNRAAAYHRKGKLDQAIADCDQAIRLDPWLSIAYINRAAARVDKKEPDKAIADCDQALLQHKGNRGRIYLLRSLAFNLKHEPARAQAEWEKAVQLDPSLRRTIVPHPAPQRPGIPTPIH